LSRAQAAECIAEISMVESVSQAFSLALIGGAIEISFPAARSVPCPCGERL
jgi:hypothetical protein